MLNLNSILKPICLAYSKPNLPCFHNPIDPVETLQQPSLKNPVITLQQEVWFHPALTWPWHSSNWLSTKTWLWPNHQTLSSFSVMSKPRPTTDTIGHSSKKLANCPWFALHMILHHFFCYEKQITTNSATENLVSPGHFAWHFTNPATP